MATETIVINYTTNPGTPPAGPRAPDVTDFTVGAVAWANLTAAQAEKAYVLLSRVKALLTIGEAGDAANRPTFPVAGIADADVLTGTTCTIVATYTPVAGGGPNVTGFTVDATAYVSLTDTQIRRVWVLCDRAIQRLVGAGKLAPPTTGTSFGLNGLVFVEGGYQDSDVQA